MRFPGLGDGWVRLDGPAGTLPVDTSIDAMTAYLRSPAPANTGGAFDASDAAPRRWSTTCAAAVGRLPRRARDAGDLRRQLDGVGVRLHPCARPARGHGGERIVCTQLDHDSNVTPWVLAAADAGADGDDACRSTRPTARSTSPTSSAPLPRGDVAWVALTGASNLTGFAPDLRAAADDGPRRRRAAARRRRGPGAAPADRRATAGASTRSSRSPYKWYGPHAGMLVLQPDLLARRRAVPRAPGRLRRAPTVGRPAPSAFEVDRRHRRRGRVHGRAAVGRGDRGARPRCSTRLEVGLRGDRRASRCTRPMSAEGRAPTTIFNLEGRDPRRRRRGARRAPHRGVERRQLRVRADRRPRASATRGGAVRAGVVRHTTADDVDALLAAVDEVDPCRRSGRLLLAKRRVLAGEDRQQQSPRREVGDRRREPVGEAGDDHRLARRHAIDGGLGHRFG